jgi:hypothetical protein
MGSVQLPGIGSPEPPLNDGWNESSLALFRSLSAVRGSHPRPVRTRPIASMLPGSSTFLRAVSDARLSAELSSAAVRLGTTASGRAAD